MFKIKLSLVNYGSDTKQIGYDTNVEITIKKQIYYYNNKLLFFPEFSVVNYGFKTQRIGYGTNGSQQNQINNNIKI